MQYARFLGMKRDGIVRGHELVPKEYSVSRILDENPQRLTTRLQVPCICSVILTAVSYVVPARYESHVSVRPKMRCSMGATGDMETWKKEAMCGLLQSPL